VARCQIANAFSCVLICVMNSVANQWAVRELGHRLSDWHAIITPFTKPRGSGLAVYGCHTPNVKWFVTEFGRLQDRRCEVDWLKTRFSHDAAKIAAEMSDRSCLPAFPEPAVLSAGPSPTRTGLPTRVRHSASSPEVSGLYSSWRWWRSSSTTVWCSIVDQSDSDRISRGKICFVCGLFCLMWLFWHSVTVWVRVRV